MTLSCGQALLAVPAMVASLTSSVTESWSQSATVKVASWESAHDVTPPCLMTQHPST